MYIVHDATSNAITFPTNFGRGHDPGLATKNHGIFGAPPATFKIIPRSEWKARADEKKERKQGLRYLRTTMNKGKPHLSFDQNGQGYCWAYSIGGTIVYNRGRSNQPYVRVSPHAVACKIKGFRDEGGWCGLSMQWAIEKGYPSERHWPQKSMARANDVAAVWANAKRQRVTESCFDAARAVYDQDMFIDLVATFLLLDIPLALDFNWWGHSVCGIEWTEIESNSWGPTIDNSWTPSWGEEGLATLQGSRAIPDNAVGTLVTTASDETQPDEVEAENTIAV